MAHSAYFQGGGIGRYTREVLDAVRERGVVRPFLICSPNFEWQEIPGVRTLPVLQPLAHPVPLLRKARFLTAQWRNPHRLLAAARKEQLDIIHLQSFHHLSFAQWRRAAAASGLKWVISAHDIKRDVAVLNKGWEDEQLKAAYRFADAILVHSNYQKQELIAFAGVLPDRIRLVPHGPYVYPTPTATREEIRTTLGIPQGVDTALFFGQIRDDKNLEAFLEALSTTGVDTHLIVAGQPGGRHQTADHYRTLCKHLGIQDRVHFYFGHVPDEEVGKFFVAADWVALPYRESFTSQSGVLNIAAQFDRPILVSNAPVLKETIEHSGIGYICSDDQPTALSEGIAAMYEKKRAITPADFQRYRHDHSWDVNARICISLYQELMA